MKPDWKPIRTAPKDGTLYLATDGEEVWSQNQPPSGADGRWRWMKDGWYGGTLSCKATHWAPMLELPRRKRK